MKILVTGATGQLGALVVDELLKLVPADEIAVSVRDPKKAEHLGKLGVDVRYANFNEYDSLTAAFSGIDRLLMISTNDLQNRVEQQRAVVRAAQETGIGFIAYTSAAKAEQSKLALAASHLTTEQAIQASGIPYSILRNNWYLENELGTLQNALNGAPWVIASGEGKIGYATRRDFAEAAARVLTGQGDENTVYELAGKPLTQAELAAIFAEAVQCEPEIQFVNEAAYGSMLSQSGMPEPVAAMMAAMQRQIGEGELDVESDDLPRLLGRPPVPLGEAIRQLLKQ